MEALRADASRLLSEYSSTNSAGNKLQRRLLHCEHAFRLLTDRFTAMHALVSRLSDTGCSTEWYASGGPMTATLSILILANTKS